MIIDGHNLIPKIPGAHLSDLNDENQLIVLLQEYARLKRKQIECFFDNAPPGWPRVRNYGLVVAKFPRPGMNADQEIRGRLGRLGNAARNYTIVSSDLAVQSSARAARAQYIGSDVFAKELLKVLENSPVEKNEGVEAGLSDAEVNMWLDLFKDPDQSPK